MMLVNTTLDWMQNNIIIAEVLSPARVVPIPIAVSDNAADITDIAGIGSGEYTSLYTNHGI